MRKIISAIFACILVSGCATRNTTIDPSQFSSYKGKEYFKIEGNIKYSERRGINVLWEQGIKSGTYMPKYQDNNGYYFYGPNYAICQGSPSCANVYSPSLEICPDKKNCPEFSTHGGIWVSKVDDKDVRLFLIIKYNDDDKAKNLSDGGILIGSLINASDGEYIVFDRNIEFGKKLYSLKYE